MSLYVKDPYYGMDLMIMNGNDDAMDKRQMDASPPEGKTGKKINSAGRAFNFYLETINQCLDVILKISPVFMLGSGIMLWSFLREIGWTHLLLPTASSPSGLSFLAISAVVFVGAVILIFLTPSLLLSPGFDFYEGGLTPARVKWILVGIATLWTVIFAMIALVDWFPEKFSWPWAVGVLYLVGLLGYAAPGLIAACNACEKQEADGGQRKGAGEDDTERLWRSVFLQHWLMPCLGDAKVEAMAGKTPLAPEKHADPTALNTSRKVPAWFGWLRPFVVVFMVLIAVLATSSPLLILIKLWGDQLESGLGTIPAVLLVLLCAVLAVLPAFIYLHTRSQNVSSAVAAKSASVAAGCLVFLSLFAMMYAPIRDRVFHLLDIQSSQEEYFLVSSPIAVQALGMLRFPLTAVPTLEVDPSKKAVGAERDMGKKTNGDAVAIGGTSAEQVREKERGATERRDKTKTEELAVKPDMPMIVKAWVGYSFGDTVLLCRWGAGEGIAKQDKPLEGGRSGDNICLPLARSELRRLPRAAYGFELK